MAKTATFTDQPFMPSNGRWVWKEETNTLEYISNNPNADRQLGKRDRKQKGIHFQDHSKRGDRGGTPSHGGRSYGVGRGRQGKTLPGQKSPSHKKKEPEDADVTLKNVKSVALGMLSEVEDISADFEALFSTEQFDEFLAYLLHYFSYFFEMKKQAEQPNPMNIEPSLAEKKYYVDLIAKQEAAQKWLGQYYCILVMGLGLQNHHHMHCGGSRVSNTYKDRNMYETLYSFCAFLVWIAFRRKEYQLVKRELGRMLRSDTFNPAIRIKHAPETEPEEEEKEGEKKKEEKKEGDERNEDEKGSEEGEDKKAQKKEKKVEKQLTPAEYRRKQGKRPAIRSIINQRSPALVSILPTPKEEAHWLFKRVRPVSPDSGTTKDDSEQDNVGTQLDEMVLTMNKLKIGIIGEPMNQFNPMTLTPHGAENEEEENEDEEKTEKRESVLPSSPHSKTPENGLSRQATAISQVTQEALSDED